MTAVQRWGGSGLAALTGLPGGGADFSRSEVLTRAQTIADGFGVDAATLLAGRAGLLGLQRQGQISAGGATRMFPTADDWCALTLARTDDVDAVGALVQADVGSDAWAALTQWAAQHRASDVVERAALLDIPVARLAEAVARGPRVSREAQRRVGQRSDPLVVDLSSMWAGPLCAQLLRGAGATVVKVESPARPDGTRAGNRRFFDWMNNGKLCYHVDFDNPALRRLLSAADVVIEGSRPGALARHGLGPEAIAARPGRVWLRITGHGASSSRAAFGDDAAVAGGLVAGVAGHPVFCADAVADPLTGLEAADAVAASRRRGGGEVVDVSMAAVAATYAALPLCAPDAAVAAQAPQPPPATPAAHEAGADNTIVDRLVAQRLCTPC